MVRSRPAPLLKILEIIFCTNLSIDMEYQRINYRIFESNTTEVNKGAENNEKSYQDIQAL